ncbi:hypothetical protein WA026_010990 [Henosepilachna vigintioctopunctata]|uniref:Intraflagellar transport protein 140 homolog n=1 Tax=Henosepilachna vigintioctopunctata TaxID=420089 RepID=A0AAW1UZS1_9CUCU
MTLYFENALRSGELSSISLNVKWHPNASLLAVASFSQEKGGFVTVFDELGDSFKENNYPYHRNYQITSLSWHPEIITLATGWENGELKIWNESDNDFLNFSGPHKSPITHVEFSEKGTRLASCDSNGSLVGWKVDNKGHIVTIFHLDLKECITHVTFRITVKHPEFDVKGLAKAAVNGDEQALDMFSNWRPKTTARKFRFQDGLDNTCFFVATQQGSLFYVNNGGSCTEILNTKGVPLTNVLYHHSKDIMVVMMEGLTVGHFSVDVHGNLTEMGKVKLSGKIQGRSDFSQRITWAGGDCLAILTGDLIVRIWDVSTNDNYVLPTTMKLYVSEEKHRTTTESFCCISYCKLNQTICAGTNLGRIYFWTKKQNSAVGENSDIIWELNNINNIGGTVKHLAWGSVQLKLPLLSVNCVTSVYIMKEQNIGTAFSSKVWATQKTATQLLVESEVCNDLLSVEHQITDMAINEKYLACTNGRMISTFKIVWKDSEMLKLNAKTTVKSPENEFSVVKESNFSCDNDSILLYKDILVILTQKGVMLKETSGITIHNILNNSAEGEAIGHDINGNFLTVFTLDGFLKIYDLTESEPKLFIPAQNLTEMISDFGEVIQARCNSTGTRIAMTLAGTNLIPDGKLYVWDIDNNSLFDYNFRKSYDDDDTFTTEFEEESPRNIAEQELNCSYRDICQNRIPLSLFWDKDDPQLLVCNAKRLKYGALKTPFRGCEKQLGQDQRKSLQDEDHIIITMFISSEDGIKMHDVKASETETRLIDVSTPFIVTLQKLSIVREVMTDFIGLEKCDKVTRDAVLDFSYNLSLGNMDAAFKSIKLVQSSSVWSILAKMCVKTRRLDVAGVCLGHMGNARAARNLRLAIADSSLPLEAQLAVLAIELDMLDEAEQLYRKCERYDLLNQLYQNQDRMEEAYSIASTKDRIHFRNTEHMWAKSLEQAGDFKEAAIKYEKANTHRVEIPRMLVDHPEELQKYMSKTNDPEMLKWWGKYNESQGDMTTALKIYSKAGDIYSQVRVLCYLGEEARAAELARQSSDKAAFYHMARHYESVGNNENAISFFVKANAYGNVVRLCKENHMTDELWNIGIVAANREKIECARYFEEVDELEKAVVLYHRAGMVHKALDLAFSSNQYDILQQIATDLDADSDPPVGKKYKEAIELCTAHNVQLTEDLATKLTPEKDQLDDGTRISILETLAESLMIQGSYHLATQKFTQAGDKIKAMKALLKSGDTDRIIFFATVSRKREIYIMAANYLQTVDWQNNPEILRNIITFYSKAKALALLANFYVACAQVEIDEFQNYEKAYEAFMEAGACLAKITAPKDPNQHERITEVIKRSTTLIKRFVDIRKLFERGDIETGLAQCRQLLSNGGDDLEVAVRRGDIYAQMIYHNVKASNFIVAKQLFDEFKQILNSSSNTSVTYYLNKELLEALAKGLNMPIGLLVPSLAKVGSADKDEGEIEEVIEE